MKAARTRAYDKKHHITAKHSGTRKHTPSSSKSRATSHGQKAHRTAKQVKAARSAAVSLGGVSLCSAAAVARSLVLAGGSVSPAAVLALYYRVADGPDAGASIWETLNAAYRWGLGGVRPAGFWPVEADDPAAALLHLELPAGAHAVAADGGRWWSWGTLWPPSAFPAAVVAESWAVTW
jgi:hypothetical protein